MTTREKLRQLLEERAGFFVSGQQVASSLEITRAAVWKAVRQLRAEGDAIEAVPNRGYRLSPENDRLSESGIREELGADADQFHILLRERVTSTSSLLKEQESNLREWTVLIAGEQSGGRGRMGRSFYSPSGSGLYLSVLLRPAMPAEKAVQITTAAAVAACGAIAECTGVEAGIKWINDLYVDGKKICGILTEGALNLETGGLDWAVMGIGFNVYPPEGGFPPEISDIAGAIMPIRTSGLRNRLAARFLVRFRELCADPGQPACVEEYRRRSFLPGRAVTVHRGSETRRATALSVDGQCRLVVRYEDGTEEALSSGEVSVRPE